MDVFKILRKYDFPEEWKPLDFNGKVDFELRLDLKTQQLTKDIYYVLRREKDNLQMNIRTEGETLKEIYPVASKEDIEKFGIKEFSKHPYLSVDMKTGTPTHLYYVPPESDGTLIKRVGLDNNKRTYLVLLAAGKSSPKIYKEIFKKWHPNYVLLYFDSDHVTKSPVAALLGYNFMNPHYEEMLKICSDF